MNVVGRIKIRAVLPWTAALLPPITYDNLDLVVSETYNDTSRTIQYGYSADGNLAKIT